MSKICLIKQPAGIGDIFYSLGIARHYQKLGYEITWPVVKEILWLREYIPDINFCDWEKDFNRKDQYHSRIPIFTDNLVYLPINVSSEMIGGLIMSSKYHYSNIDPSIWLENFKWNRNFEKENRLYYNVLCLKDDEEYIFVNQNYVTPPRTEKFSMGFKTEDKTIEMGYIEGYTVFDWYKVIEKASGIVTIDTCIQYMIETMSSLKAQFYYCYLRNGINTHTQIKDLFRKTPWMYLTKENIQIN